MAFFLKLSSDAAFNFGELRCSQWIFGWVLFVGVQWCNGIDGTDSKTVVWSEVVIGKVSDEG